MSLTKIGTEKAEKGRMRSLGSRYSIGKHEKYMEIWMKRCKLETTNETIMKEKRETRNEH